MVNRICEVDGCEKSVRSRGFCHNHYVILSSGRDPHGDYKEEGRQQRIKAAWDAEEKRCKVCTKPKPLSEFYPNHFGFPSPYCKKCQGKKNWESRKKALARIKASQPPKVRVKDLECTADGCTRKQASKGFCGTHFNQFHRSGEVKEIATYENSFISETERLCTSCYEVKSHSDFYKRGDGSVNSKCKVCSVLSSSFLQALKNGKYEAAKQKLSQMPKKDRIKYQEKYDVTIDSERNK